MVTGAPALWLIRLLIAAPISQPRVERRLMPPIGGSMSDISRYRLAGFAARRYEARRRRIIGERFAAARSSAACRYRSPAPTTQPGRQPTSELRRI